jgi:hypothetical protein
VKTPSAPRKVDQGQVVSAPLGSRHMPYGEITENKAINATIYRCFEHIQEGDARRFVEKFRDQRDEGNQVMHTFRELVLGAYLGCKGFEVRHEYSIAGKKPDWCVMSRTGAVECIVELTNFHLDMATEREIEEQIRSKGIASVWLPDMEDRLYHCIWSKAPAYKALAEKKDIAYVIAVSSDFKAPVDWEEELYPSLTNPDYGLFSLYPPLSGVLHFKETCQRYVFGYLANPEAHRTMHLPNGVF